MKNIHWVWIKPHSPSLTNIENSTSNFCQSVKICCREKKRRKQQLQSFLHYMQMQSETIVHFLSVIIISSKDFISTNSCVLNCCCSFPVRVRKQKNRLMVVFFSDFGDSYQREHWSLDAVLLIKISIWQC